MKQISFDLLLKKLKKIKFDDFDLVVGIGMSGLIPASIISYLLNKEMKIINIKYRDNKNKIIYKNPRIMNKNDFKIKNKKILIVDDVSRTGKTLQAAKKSLNGNEIKTFVINGKADYSLFNTKECLKMPWIE